MTQKELDAVIRLLDDPDDIVYKAVEKKILSTGASIIPALENAWMASGDNKLVQSRIENIVPKLESDTLINLFTQWKSNGGDLREISWLVSRIQFFGITRPQFDDMIDTYRTKIPAFAPDNYSPLEQVKIINYSFFRKMGFHTAQMKDFYNPINCFPSNVMDVKEGNPVTLALIYMILAQESGLPIYGVNLPKNFILAYRNANNETLFYINPTSNGAIFEKNEIDRFLKEIGLKPQAQFYEPCDNSIIIKRLLCRLEYSYRNKHDFKNSDKVLKLMNTLGTPLNKNIEWE